MENIECILIKINEDLEGVDLYERTRKCWKGNLNNIKTKKIVFCIFNSKIKEVYEVFNWEECPRDTNQGVQFIGKVSAKFRELINLDVSSIYKRGNANPIMYKDLADIVQLNNHGKIIIANITWSDNGWTDRFTDNNSNHRYVQKGGLAHECYNFNFESEWNDNYQYGFFQATNQPKLNGNKNIVFFHSQNKIVGVYANVELGKFDKKIFDDDFDFNLKADKSLSFKFDTFLEMDKEDYLDGKQRIGQIGFNYIENKSAKNILEDFIDLSTNESLKEKANDILKLIVNINFPILEEGEKDMKQIQPLNQILYGPPGTGKTYNTINKALEIIFEKEDPEGIDFYEFDFNPNLTINYKDALLEKDEKLKRKILNGIFDYYFGNQIKFVTFHQSYGYEEFVEGIKAIPVGEDGNEDGNEMIYKVVDGIFKSLVKECTSRDEIQNNNLTNYENSTIWKMSLGDSLSGEDQIYFKEAIDTNTIIMGYGGEINYTNCDDRKSIEQLNTHDTSVTMIHRFKNELKTNDILIISDGNRKFKAIVQVIGDYYYDDDSDFKHKRKIKWLKKFTTSRPYNEISDRYFTQVTLNKPHGVNRDKLIEYLSEKTTIDNSNKNYVLIIDEINRGNISKIFGELITLIESSKRTGKDEAIEIILPYSGESFSIPSNLYILGTMNTADRSIALMDTALRRRFEFIEMMPNLDILEQIDDINGVSIKLLLETINKRIEYLYDRDHTIGHAYFMSLNEQIKDESNSLRYKTEEEKIVELKSIFQNKIIPLLQEYFYDDWEKIRLVLGDNQKEDENLQFIKIKQGYNLKDLFGDKGLDLLDIDDESNIYEINKAAFDNHESYIKVYEK
jgi:5-methylcytosine-specific restriction protein B